MPRKKPKYRRILEKLEADIAAGRYAPGAKLPSEAALMRRFSVSRITVVRALRELQFRDIIDRIAGAGSFVHGRGSPSPASAPGQRVFGLLVPDLEETEILETICGGISSALEFRSPLLLWGLIDKTGPAKQEQAWRFCRQIIARRVSGVFFAPLEFEDVAERVNRRIVAAFERARIPIVLLDRRDSGSPNPSRLDLVGLNNRQAGFVAAEHLLKLGARRLGFVHYRGSPQTIAARRTGVCHALSLRGLRPALDLEVRLEQQADTAAAAIAAGVRKARAQALVCVNDRVAGHVMHALLGHRIRIPDDVRVVGIDDASYAALLPVPLTTVRQPCREIGQAALWAMIERLEQRDAPAREILLDGRLVVRKSCGAG